MTNPYLGVEAQECVCVCVGDVGGGGEGTQEDIK